MAELYLYGGVVAEVDDEDLDRLQHYNWYVGNRGRICCNGYDDGRRTTLSLHRVIMDVKDNRLVIAKDNNLLNCRKSNLRITTKRETPPNPKGRPRRDRSGGDVLVDSDSLISAIVTDEHGRKVLRSLPRNRLSREERDRLTSTSQLEA